MAACNDICVKILFLGICSVNEKPYKCVAKLGEFWCLESGTRLVNVKLKAKSIISAIEIEKKEEIFGKKM